MNNEKEIVDLSEVKESPARIPVMIVKHQYDTMVAEKEGGPFTQKTIRHGVYHIRMDKPFESYLSRLMVKIAAESTREGEVAQIIMEEWEEETYLKLVAANFNINRMPAFIKPETG